MGPSAIVLHGTLSACGTVVADLGSFAVIVRMDSRPSFVVDKESE